MPGPNVSQHNMPCKLNNHFIFTSLVKNIKVVAVLSYPCYPEKKTQPKTTETILWKMYSLILFFNFYFDLFTTEVINLSYSNKDTWLNQVKIYHIGTRILKSGFSRSYYCYWPFCVCANSLMQNSGSVFEYSLLFIKLNWATVSVKLCLFGKHIRPYNGLLTLHSIQPNCLNWNPLVKFTFNPRDHNEELLCREVLGFFPPTNQKPCYHEFISRLNSIGCIKGINLPKAALEKELGVQGLNAILLHEVHIAHYKELPWVEFNLLRSSSLVRIIVQSIQDIFNENVLWVWWVPHLPNVKT